MNLEPAELEALLEKNLATLKFEDRDEDHMIDYAARAKFIISIFRGAHGYVAARGRLSQRDGLSRYEWTLGIEVDRAEEHLKDGKRELSDRLTLVATNLRDALKASIGAARYLALYSPTHAEELWNILRVGLTARLSLIDSISALAPNDDAR